MDKFRWELYPEFEEAVFSLKTDSEYSKPFKTPNGWHIVKGLATNQSAT